MQKPVIGMKVARLKIYPTEISFGTIVAIDEEINKLTVRFFSHFADYDMKKLTCPYHEGTIDASRIVFVREGESDDEVTKRIMGSVVEYYDLEYLTLKASELSFKNADLELMQEVTSFIRAKLAERGY